MVLKPPLKTTSWHLKAPFLKILYCKSPKSWPSYLSIYVLLDLGLDWGSFTEATTNCEIHVWGFGFIHLPRNTILFRVRGLARSRVLRFSLTGADGFIKGESCLSASLSVVIISVSGLQSPWGDCVEESPRTQPLSSDTWRSALVKLKNSHTLRLLRRRGRDMAVSETG